MREQSIEKVMTTHSLPWNIAEQVVDAVGTIDQEKLQAVLLGVSWGKSPASSADPKLTQASERCAIGKPRPAGTAGR